MIDLTAKETGYLGEEFVAAYLESNGCTILARNYHVHGGELDIVAKKGNILHVVEVKTRTKSPLVAGDFAVNKTKKARIIRAAERFVSDNEIDLSVVFDVAVVEHDVDKFRMIKYIQRAFSA